MPKLTMNALSPLVGRPLLDLNISVDSPKKEDLDSMTPLSLVLDVFFLPPHPWNFLQDFLYKEFYRIIYFIRPVIFNGIQVMKLLCTLKFCCFSGIF